MVLLFKYFPHQISCISINVSVREKRLLTEPKYLYCLQMSTIEPRTFINAINCHFSFFVSLRSGLLQVYRMPSIHLYLGIECVDSNVHLKMLLEKEIMIWTG